MAAPRDATARLRRGLGPAELSALRRRVTVGSCRVTLAGVLRDLPCRVWATGARSPSAAPLHLHARRRHVLRTDGRRASLASPARATHLPPTPAARSRAGTGGAKGACADAARGTPSTVTRTVRVAAPGDVHVPGNERPARGGVPRHPGGRRPGAPGDLMTHGDLRPGAGLLHAARHVSVPVLAVLGNHDCHEGQEDAIRAVLEDAGVRVLERSWTVVDVDASTSASWAPRASSAASPQSFAGLRRAAPAAALSRDLEGGGSARARPPGAHRLRTAHRASPLRPPTDQTLEGEPLGIHTYLGSAGWRHRSPSTSQTSSSTAMPMRAASRPDRQTPVYNVAVHVIGRDFYVFDLEVTPRHSACRGDPGRPALTARDR